MDGEQNHGVRAKTYPQDWPAYNRAQQQEKELFMELLSGLCEAIPLEPPQVGKPPFPLRDLAYGVVFKVYSTFSGRRFSTDMSIALERGLVNRKPHYNTIFKGFQDERLMPILHRLIEMSAKPLKVVETDFAQDSTGFSTSRFSRWFNFRYGKEQDVRIWLKVHVMCGVKTNIVTAVEITEGHAADIVQFKPLLKQTAKNFTVLEVSADKAYLSRPNLKAVAELGAVPFIPFKSNSIGKPFGVRIWRQMHDFFSLYREEFMLHYHKRSNVETTFSMIKAKFGAHIRSRHPVAQRNELLAKILCHNICVLIQEMHELATFQFTS